MVPAPGGLRYARVLLLAVALAITLKIFVVDAVCVPTRSMEPAVLPGDCLLLEKTGFSPSFLASRLPARGDVVAFELPGGAGEEGALGLKRCIAVAGDTIEYRDGAILVNGEVAVSGLDGGGPFLSGADQKVVPRSGEPSSAPGGNAGGGGEDCIFVVGDRHDVSLDSRSWGWIPARSVVGKAAMVYWSRGDDGAVRWPRIGALVR